MSLTVAIILPHKKFSSVRAGSQYIVRVASQPEVIIFSMGLDARDTGIESSSIPVSHCIQTH